MIAYQKQSVRKNPALKPSSLPKIRHGDIDAIPLRAAGRRVHPHRGAGQQLILNRNEDRGTASATYHHVPRARRNVPKDQQNPESHSTNRNTEPSGLKQSGGKVTAYFEISES